MKTRGAILSLSLALISGSSCYAARSVHSGINQAALAAVRPVFVPWIRCNKALDNDIRDYHFDVNSLASDVPQSSKYCHAAYSSVRDVRLGSNLAGNAAMKKALDALSHLLKDKAVLAFQFQNYSDCDSYGHPTPCYHGYYIDEMERIVDQLIVNVEIDRNLSTRFWYYLNHTA